MAFFRQREVEFLSKGRRSGETRYAPTGMAFPLLIMGGRWCYVKEVVMPHNAEAIVAKGVAVLTFDYRRTSVRKKLAVLPKVSHMSLYSNQSDLATAGWLAADFAAEHPCAN